jgi:UDP-N-acetylmuramoyl-tripeptide--D-alanyl-D-alanine ligase
MIPMTLVEVADCVGGRLAAPHPEAVRDIMVTGPASVDSRAVEAGGLFVALAGEQVDGHDFAAAAVANGASAVLSTRPVEGVPCVVVEDAVVALGLLARDVRCRLPGCMVIGITGSQGKTGVKDLLAQVLGRAGRTIASQGSYNNEIGVPLTALHADRDTRFLVSELGARGRGHIGYLAEIVRPHLGVVLNVGVAHLGEFGSRDAIAVAKGELVEMLPADGVAVLNADDDLVRAMARRTAARVLTFGSGDADVRYSTVDVDQSGRPHFRLACDEGEADLTLQLVGEHNASNAAAAAAAALAAGLGWTDVVEGLAAATPRSRWRMEVHERADGVTVVNDAYNANPDSMRAALKTLAVLGGGRRRTVAVLGEMRELGAASQEQHDAIGRLVVRLNVSRLVVVGEGARPTHLGAGLEGSWAGESVFVPDAESAVEFLRDDIAPGDVVLVKASRAAGLERVAEALLRPASSREDEVPG